MNQLTSNFDTSKIFVWDNRYEKNDYTNSGYADETLEAGTLMGRVAATAALVKHDSNAVDGSQYPVGVLKSEHEVVAGDTVEVYICVSGDVVLGKLVLKAGDSLYDVIDGRALYDRIAGDTLGIKLVESTELTGEDNQ